MKSTNIPAESYLAAIVESSDDAIVAKTLDGIVTSWNNAAEKLFGYSSAEIVGKHIGLIIPQDKQDEEFIILGKIRTGERIDHFETVRRTKHGDLIDISLTVSPIRDDKGNIIGASKIAKNITEQKRTEEALRLASLRKDEFLATISHELRTPMNAIMGLANLLERSESVPEKEKEYVRVMLRSADDMMLLINNVLDISKLENDGINLEQIEFNLQETIDKTIGLLRVKADEKNISLSASYGPSLNKYYMGDPLRIEQIFTNLLSNGIKFTETGSVEISVALKSQNASQTVLAIEVTDTGIGISEDKVSSILNKFVQADSSMARKYGGSGLGLSICKSLIEKMNGSIAIRSRLGLGTTVALELPLANSSQIVSLKPSASEANPVTKNILVVEDYAANALIISALLDQSGYDYDIAENGLDGLRKFQKNSYDVILMDVQMPDMDGFECAGRIRDYEREKNRKRTPVIAMTAHILEKDKQKCIEAGMDDFIAKPFKTPLFLQKLEEIIPKKQTRTSGNLRS